MASTILFFDDLRLNRRDNVIRRMGRPRRVEDAVYRDPYLVCAWGFPSVFKEEQSGLWRMTYQACQPFNLGHFPLLAESEDGLHWHPRDTTTDLNLPERAFPHQLLPLEVFREWSCCYLDPYANPQERIKGVVVHRSRRHYLDTDLWLSPDGVHWRRSEGVQWGLNADPPTAAFWCQERETYVLTTRPDLRDRRIALCETRNWRTFTEPELALQADSADLPLTELYGMPVFPYEGMYVGFLWLFHVAPQVEDHCPHKYCDGHVDCQITYSLNGWHWQRCLREPFVANGTPGEPDSGCVYPASLIQRANGSLLIYASACTHEHGYSRPGSGSIVAYELRRDGFVYLESTGGPGVIGTRPLYWRGGDIALNVQSQGGEVRAQVTNSRGAPLDGYRFADCAPFSGDNTEWVPTWSGQQGLQLMVGKTLRIEVQMKNARIYAIRGNFVPLTATQCWRYEHDGLVPERPPGF